MYSLPASFAMEQLRTGAVRIPFAQLRQSSPPGTFSEVGTHDDSLVDLPLPLILSAMGPAGLARRADQKRMVLPDEVAGLFGGKHSHVNGAAGKAPAPPPALIPAPVAPKATTPFLPKPVIPVVLPPAELKPKSAVASVPAAPRIPTPLSIPFVFPRPAAPLPSASPRPAPTPPATAPIAVGEPVLVSVEAVSGAWAEPVRREIEQLNLGSAMISLPVNRLEPGLKAGRVVFAWAELCGWVNPPVPPPANGESQVELPLKVIAPLFMAKHRPATQRKMVAVDESLPQLFTGLMRPAAPKPVAVPPPPVQVPAAVVVPDVFAEDSGQRRDAAATLAVVVPEVFAEDSGQRRDAAATLAVVVPDVFAEDSGQRRDAAATLAVVAPEVVAEDSGQRRDAAATLSVVVPDVFAEDSGQRRDAAATLAVIAPEVVVEDSGQRRDAAATLAVVAPEVVAEVSASPAKTDWTPTEMAQRILALPGVAGALVASNDGLLVAGQMPAPLKAATMAAFLPQIFSRVGLCTEEVQLGTLRALRLSAGPASCAVWKAGTLYLAVLGQPGQTLPEAALEPLAVQLAQLNH
jgi:predicted regulator of Ras-like GTPase activity (Roadblock/LC7/MglB family)